MTTIYDIPRTIEYDKSFALIKSYDQVEQSGDVDYGPHYWIEHSVNFSADVSKATAAKVFGDYLAYNYQDNFRQAEVRQIREGEASEWLVRIHMAWGSRPYYTPVAR